MFVVKYFKFIGMVYTVGETVFDIIFKSINEVSIKPGGAMLNTAISLGRLNIGVSHISKISNDKPSDLIIDFLNKNSVNTEYVYRSKNIKTNLALAYLNDSNNAEYTFYKDNSDLQNGLFFPQLEKGDFIHFGSFFSINPQTHKQLHVFLNNSCSNCCVKIYDPNFRKNHLHDLEMHFSLIEKNFRIADIVKGSDEDFENIFGITSGKEVWNKMKEYDVKVLFYTKGENGSEFYSEKGSFSLPTSKIKAVSTIGAGDTYSAGIIYFLNLYSNNKSFDLFDIEDWKKCVSIAHNFASQTCQSMDNYLSEKFCIDFKNV